jgi:predicted DNA-binding transcriptional regulator AlpA
MKNKFLEGGIPKVAEVLGLNERTIYRQAKLGKFPFIKKVASRYVVIEDSFNDWMFTSAITELKELKESQRD